MTDTLLVRNFPATLSKQDIEGFLNHIGAVQISVHGSDLKKKIAFARFKSIEVSREALYRLHQHELFGSRLVAEFSTSSFSKNDQSNEDYKNKERDEKSELHEEFLRNLNNWTNGLNFRLPPPSHLYYRYPSQTPNVLFNIISLLSHNKKFYTQVVHLMNKMNVPSPFEPTFPIYKNDTFVSFINYVSNYAKNNMVNSSSEDGSEMESESEMKTVSKLLKKRPASIVPKFPTKKKRAIFVPKTNIKANDSVVNKLNVTEVFEQITLDTNKKIQVRMPSEISSGSAVSSINIEETSSGFGVIIPPVKDDNSSKESRDQTTNKDQDKTNEIITDEELASNRSTNADHKTGIYKNYDPGVPSSRLYIKNLDKHVTKEDLERIYKKFYLEGAHEDGNKFSIKLLDSGRMKGQAFISLQSERLAKEALKASNGYILKGKEMVVYYSKSKSTA